MSCDLKKRIQLICRYCTTVLIFIIAAMLIVSCIGIYQSGDRPFTREVIANTASRIAVPGYLCLLTMIGGFLFSDAAPKEIKHANHRYQLIRLRNRAQHADAHQYHAICLQRRLRRYYRIGTGVLVTVLLLCPVIYFADPNHFSISHLTRDIIRAVTVSMVPAALALGFLYICSVLEDASIQREIEVLKNIEIKENNTLDHPENRKMIPVMRCALFLIAAIFIILGIDNGGIQAVLGKAIRICTECIGLG